MRIGLENDPGVEAGDGGQGDVSCDEVYATSFGAQAPSQRTNQRVAETVGIFTDSLSNLEKIRQGTAETSEQKQLFDCLMKYPHDPILHHVSAHRDNKKNIEVDNLCDATINPVGRKKILNLGGTKTPSKIKIWMNEFIHRRRMETVIQCEIGRERRSKTQAFITKHVSSNGWEMDQRPKACNRPPRKEGVLYSKLRGNNWIQCQHFQHRIEKADNALCRKCGKIDDIEHVMNECEIHTDQREVLKLRLNHPGKVMELLASNDDTLIKEFAKFLVQVSDKRKDIEKKIKEASLISKVPEIGVENSSMPEGPIAKKTPAGACLGQIPARLIKLAEAIA